MGATFFRFVIPTEAQRSGEPALSEVEWGSAVSMGEPSRHKSRLAQALASKVRFADDSGLKSLETTVHVNPR
jgi:hypothetical protein